MHRSSENCSGRGALAVMPGKGDGHREGCKGCAVAGGGQLHCADVARQVQADNLARVDSGAICQVPK